MIEGRNSTNVSLNTVSGASAATGSDSDRGRFAGRDTTVEHYHSLARGWLADFSDRDRGRELAGQLDTLLERQYFPEALPNVAKVLADAKFLTCHSVCTIHHSGFVNSASFSRDGRYLVTASADHTAQIWEFIAGQWQEKATIRHSASVNNASFSPDGTHLVTATDDYTAKIWRLVAGQWQESATNYRAFWLGETCQFQPRWMLPCDSLQ